MNNHYSQSQAQSEPQSQANVQHPQRSTPSPTFQIKKSSILYADHGSTTPAGHIYDQTYQNYRKKQRFSKDPKYSYFNAVMQMRHKLSSGKRQVYKNVFDPEQRKLASSSLQQPLTNNRSKTFYLNSSPQSSKGRGSGCSGGSVKVHRLRGNSYKIYKDNQNDSNNVGAINYRHDQQHPNVANRKSVIVHSDHCHDNKNNKSLEIKTAQNWYNHKENHGRDVEQGEQGQSQHKRSQHQQFKLKANQKNIQFCLNKNEINLDNNSKNSRRHRCCVSSYNRNHDQQPNIIPYGNTFSFDILDGVSNGNCKDNNQSKRTTLLRKQPPTNPNPRPRLDEIMAEYRKMNRVSSKYRNQKGVGANSTSTTTTSIGFSRQFVDKLNKTNKLLRSTVVNNHSNANGNGNKFKKLVNNK